MVKSDLKTGMTVVSENGWVGKVLCGTSFGDIILWYLDGEGASIKKYRTLETVNEDLTYGFDKKIVAVYEHSDIHGILCDYRMGFSYNDMLCLWRRPEVVKEVTMREVEEKFGCKVKIKAEEENNN